MCGRYVTPATAALERAYQLDARSVERFLSVAMLPSYNVAPTQQVPILRVLRDRGGVRELEPMRWGLVPYWARGISPKFSTINARVETLTTAASFKGPWSRGQRCIFPAAGFYEWQVLEDGKTKQPYYIRPAGDDELFSIGGLWDVSRTDDGQEIVSCTIITMPANELLAEIHNVQHRMPLILPPEAIDAWLRGTVEEAAALLAPYPSELMRAHPVSRRVNTPANNDAMLLDQV